MARRRRRSEGRRRTADNSLLTVVLAIGAVMLLSGSLTGFQVGSGSRDELEARWARGSAPPGSQISNDEICYDPISGDLVIAGANRMFVEEIYGKPQLIIARCEVGTDGRGVIRHDVCDKTITSTGQRKVGMGQLRNTLDAPNSGVECRELTDFPRLNSAGIPPGDVVQPRANPYQGVPAAL